MLKEKRRILDYISGNTQQAGIHPPTLRRMLIVYERAVREDQMNKDTVRVIETLDPGKHPQFMELSAILSAAIRALREKEGK